MSRFNRIILLIVLLIWGYNGIVNGQCPRKLYCNPKDLGDYDYMGQTHYATLSPGDTSSITIVCYANRDYRVIVCGTKELKEITWTMKEMVKTQKKGIKEIKKTAIEGESYQPTYVVDTVWGMMSYFEPRLVYDNLQSEVPFWERSIKHTTRYIIEVIIPEGNPDIIGCVSIMVGSRPTLSKKFYK